jgi:inhibitor of growth protein 4
MQIDSHVKRLDEDLNNFAEDLKQGTIMDCHYIVVSCYTKPSTGSVSGLILFLFVMYSEGKLSPDEPAILPPLPIIVPKIEKRRNFYGTPQSQSKRIDFRDRDWDRERDRDFELMPPPGSHRKDFPVPVEVEQPIDPNEPTYCVCHQV